MQKIGLFIILLTIVSISFVSCGGEDIIKNTEKQNYTFTYKVTYNGNSEIKQVRAALFDYETAVQNNIPAGPPSSALSYPKTALEAGGIDFSKEIEIKLNGIEGKKYLVVIYGDVDTTDGKQEVHKIDPIYTLTNFTPTKDEVFNIELKDQEINTNDCSKENLTGSCETGKICSEGVCVIEHSNDCSTTNLAGKCPTGQTCNNGICENTSNEKSYNITLTINYSGNKEIKRIGIAGYDNNSYSGIPKYAYFIEDTITFPYTFTFDPTKDGTFKLDDNYNGNFYIWLYGDIDGKGFKPSNSDPQVKFMVVLPENNITKTIEIIDL